MRDKKHDYTYMQMATKDDRELVDFIRLCPETNLPWCDLAADWNTLSEEYLAGSELFATAAAQIKVASNPSLTRGSVAGLGVQDRSVSPVAPEFSGLALVQMGVQPSR